MSVLVTPVVAGALTEKDLTAAVWMVSVMDFEIGSGDYLLWVLEICQRVFYQIGLLISYWSR